MGNQDSISELVALGWQLLPFYAASAGPLGAIAAILAVFLQGRKAGWLLCEGPLLLMPFFVWLLFMLYVDLRPSHVKSLANVLAEPYFCGVAGGLVLYPRLFARSAPPRKRALITGISAGIASLAAIAICLLFPTLPL